jgi:hypothetical protein
MIKKSINPAYATFMNLLEILKDLLSLFAALLRVLFARIYVPPIRNVAEIFTAKNAMILVLTMPVRNGLASEAPKNKTPTAVVTQSMEPNKTIRKLGNSSDFSVYDFNVYIEAFSFSLLLLSSQTQFVVIA